VERAVRDPDVRQEGMRHLQLRDGYRDIEAIRIMESDNDVYLFSCTSHAIWYGKRFWHVKAEVRYTVMVRNIEDRTCEGKVNSDRK
jgi:hypothetical protein